MKDNDGKEADWQKLYVYRWNIRRDVNDSGFKGSSNEQAVDDEVYGSLESLESKK